MYAAGDLVASVGALVAHAAVAPIAALADAKAACEVVRVPAPEVVSEDGVRDELETARPQLRLHRQLVSSAAATYRAAATRAARSPGVLPPTLGRLRTSLF